MVVEPAELQPCEPYLATPALEPEQRKATCAEPEPTVEVVEEPQPFEVAEVQPPANVTALRPHDRVVFRDGPHNFPSEPPNPFKYRRRG